MARVMTYRVAAGRTAPRRQLDFGAGWRFRKGDWPEVSWPAASWPAFDDGDWEGVVLPHCFNAADTFIEPAPYRGPVWYRKTFRLSGMPGRRLQLVLEGSFAVTTVYLNGQELATSVDGYTGLAVDLTDALQPDDNVLAVRVDNSHDPDVLPGRLDPDYDLYGGLYREAYLVSTGPVYVPRSGVAVRTPVVSAQRALVEATVDVHGAAQRPVTVAATILDPAGRSVATAQAEVASSAGDESVELAFPPLAKPRLWSLDSPQLYRLVTEVAANGRPTDRVETTFGLRWFEFDVDGGFFLNGEPVRLWGVNRHQDYPGLGNALPAGLQVMDAELLHDMGANFVRLSHYPQHPAFLDACDRLGICVYQEIASWQFIGGPVFARRAEEMMRAMIRRDLHHPSIILWGLLNEGRSRPLFERLHKAAHQEDPSRPTIYAENNPEKGLDLGTVTVPDVLGLNYEINRLDELRQKLAGLKLLSSEHANAGTKPNTADPALQRAQADRISAELDELDARPWLAGSALWSMHDYGTQYAVSRPVQRSGCFDEYRRPKESYYLLCARWRHEPFVHIAGHWNPTTANLARQVRVYTNCDRTRLLLNGKDLGDQVDRPWCTWELPYTPGCLEAVGVRGGVEVRHELRTTGEPAALVLESSAAELAGPGDGCLLTAALVDAVGLPILTGQHEITFSATGPLRLCGVGGLPAARTLAGVARMAAVWTGGKGAATAVAAVGSLSSNDVAVQVR